MFELIIVGLLTVYVMTDGAPTARGRRGYR